MFGICRTRDEDGARQKRNTVKHLTKKSTNLRLFESSPKPIVFHCHQNWGLRPPLLYLLWTSYLCCDTASNAHETNPKQKRVSRKVLRTKWAANHVHDVVLFRSCCISCREVIHPISVSGNNGHDTCCATDRTGLAVNACKRGMFQVHYLTTTSSSVDMKKRSYCGESPVISKNHFFHSSHRIQSRTQSGLFLVFLYLL